MNRYERIINNDLTHGCKSTFGDGHFSLFRPSTILIHITSPYQNPLTNAKPRNKPLLTRRMQEVLDFKKKHLCSLRSVLSSVGCVCFVVHGCLFLSCTVSLDVGPSPSLWAAWAGKQQKCQGNKRWSTHPETTSCHQPLAQTTCQCTEKSERDSLKKLLFSHLTLLATWGTHTKCRSLVRSIPHWCQKWVFPEVHLMQIPWWSLFP